MTGSEGFRGAAPRVSAGDVPGTRLETKSNVTINAGQVIDGAFLDVSAYQSVRGRVVFFPNAAGEKYLQVVATWLDSTGQVETGRDVFAVNPNDTDSEETFYRLPCRGEGLVITAWNMSGSNGTYAYTVNGSYQPVDQPDYSEWRLGNQDDFGGDGTVYQRSGLLIAASSRLKMALWRGRVLAVVRNRTGGVATGTIELRMPSSPLGDVFVDTFQVAVGAVGRAEWVLPARPCVLTLTGSGAGNTYDITVIGQP